MELGKTKISKKDLKRMLENLKSNGRNRSWRKVQKLLEQRKKEEEEIIRLLEEL